MLYLAEVQKKAGVFGAGAKVDLKLWAQQRSEDRWQGLTGSEVLGSDKGADKAGEFKDGALVLVDVNDRSGQIQRIQDATKTIVSNFQNSSRLKDKLKDQEDEIEQWKQSLTYQSQELNRREMEMESRRDQMSQLEDELHQMEQQKEEFLRLQGEAEHLRSELNQRDEELKKSWESLRREMETLESRKREGKGTGSVDPQRIAQIRDILTRLTDSPVLVEGLQEQVSYAFEALNYQKAIVAQHLQQFDVYQNQAQQLQDGLNHLVGSLDDRWQQYLQVQGSFNEAYIHVQSRQQVLNAYQDQIHLLQAQIDAQSVLQQQINLVIGGLDPEAANQIDFTALEEMPLADLEKRVQDLQKTYDRDRTFVGDQEEELALISQDIEEKREQMAIASEFDRLNMENEISDLQSQYNLIDESVSPQRSRLRQDKAILKAHHSVLNRRKGVEVTPDSDIDVAPLLQQLDQQKLQLTESLVQLQNRVNEEQTNLEQVQANLAAQEQQLQQEHQDLRQLELEVRNQASAVAERWSQVRSYQELLQPTQETLNNLEERLQGVTQQMGYLQGLAQQQSQGMIDLQQAVQSLE
ncbi:MAG: pilus motility taxis protein HmpF [Prochlorotrichaceae cyanobacterium]